MITVIASVLSLSAVATVHQSWRSRTLALFVVGLLLWLISGVVFSFAQGWEFGVLITLCLPGILVWPFVLANQIVLPKPKNSPEPRALNFSRANVLRNGATYTVVLFAFFIIALLITLGISALTPFSTAGKMGLGIILLPVLWGLCVYHYLATSSKIKILAAYSVIAGLCLPILMLFPL